MKLSPNIPSYLLWEYDLKTFDYERSGKVVIERVIQNGTLQDWREMLRFYGKKTIIETVDWSAQLTKREKDLTLLFLDSDALICTNL